MATISEKSVVAIKIVKHPTAAGKVLATVAGGRVDGDAFRAYCTGGGYDPINRGRIMSGAQLVKYVGVLDAAGLPIVMDEAAKAMMQTAREDSSSLPTPMSNVTAEEKLSRVTKALARKGRKLFPYQVEGVRWLAGAQAALLGDEMGTGKSLQSIAAADTRVVILCPSAARGNWANEVAMARPDLTVSQCEGWGSFRWPEEGEAVILTYDCLPPVIAEKKEVGDALASPYQRVRDAVSPEMIARVVTPPAAGMAPANVTVIADEAHALKGSAFSRQKDGSYLVKTARTARFRHIAKLATHAGGRVFLLTATPMLNNPMELWNVLTAANLAERAFGKFDDFSRIAGGIPGQWGLQWDPRHMNKELVASKLKTVCLRRLKSDVLPQLPEKTHTWTPIKVRDLLSSGELATLLQAEELEVLAETGLPDFEKTSKARAVLAKAKIPAMLEVVESFESQDTPLVVFSAHRSPVDALVGRCGWEVITGDTPAATRTAIIARFQAGELRGVALTIAAGGVAVTLTKASNALFVDSSWTPAIDNQAEDRIHRIGQSNACQYIHLEADSSLDAHVRRLHEKKNSFLESVDMSSHGADERVAPMTEKNAVFEQVSLKTPEVHVTSLEDYEQAVRNKAAKVKIEEDAAAAARKTARARDRKAARKAETQETFVKSLARSARPAATEEEERAIAGLFRLAGMDDDFAKETNGVGFSKKTTTIGHQLVWCYEIIGTLTDEQWRDALATASIHRKQLANLL